MMKEASSRTKAKAYYSTIVEPRVSKVITASSSENDIVRGMLLDEIYKTQNARSELRKKYPNILNSDVNQS